MKKVNIKSIVSVVSIVSIVSIVFIVSIAVLAISSCDKMENAGDLAGNWQLTSWTDNATGAVKADNTKQIFYTVKRELLQIQKHETGHQDNFACLCLYQHKGDSLILTKAFQNKANTDSLVAFSYLAKYGVAADGRFHIDLLNDDNMVLRNSENTLSFRKY